MKSFLFSLLPSLSLSSGSLKNTPFLEEREKERWEQELEDTNGNTQIILEFRWSKKSRFLADLFPKNCIWKQEIYSVGNENHDCEFQNCNLLSRILRLNLLQNSVFSTLFCSSLHFYEIGSGSFFGLFKPLARAPCGTIWLGYSMLRPGSAYS